MTDPRYKRIADDARRELEADAILLVVRHGTRVHVAASASDPLLEAELEQEALNAAWGAARPDPLDV